MTTRKRLILTLVASLPTACFGWGKDGHHITAEIASAYLDPQAKAAVKTLLVDQSLADVSTWADEIRNDPRYRWAEPLHYANVQPGSKVFDLRRDCPKGKCVVSAITKYAAVLRDKSATTEQKQEALKFLVHFVGDVHQPLHVALAHDKGGNDIAVELFYNRTDLHKVWDDLLIRRAKKPWRQYADDLAKGITKERIDKVSKSMNPSDWATESYLLAVSNAYAIPKDGVLGQEYCDRNIPVVNERLSMAGVRLAVLLNQVLGEGKIAASAPSATTERAVPKAIKFVGSRNSKVYHYVGCSAVKTIKPENLVEYDSAPQGKRLHEGCPK